ncbi:uncharacterized protein [Physcomitrium patens]|uniref:uncharacterized protein isoform X3 n=1 Tax=Physcomitrium patens TaxID=3218 RepID=UPI003CCE003A
MVTSLNPNAMTTFRVLWDSGKSGSGCGGCSATVSCIVECLFRNSFTEYLRNRSTSHAGEGDGSCRKSWRNAYNERHQHRLPGLALWKLQHLRH